MKTARLDRLELDIDLRLHALWADTIDIGDWTLDKVAKFMRAAYGQGYRDALAEAERGELCKAHGYAIPQRGEYRRAA